MTNAQSGNGPSSSGEVLERFSSRDPPPHLNAAFESRQGRAGHQFAPTPISAYPYVSPVVIRSRLSAHPGRFKGAGGSRKVERESKSHRQSPVIHVGSSSRTSRRSTRYISA